MNEIDVDELRREIRLILKDADLNSLSSKKVRQMLENHFHRDLTERKKEIDEILMDEITKNHSNDQISEQSNEHLPIQHDDKEEKSFKSTKKTKKILHNEKHSEKSDEELAMKIHQEENRPSLRHSRPQKYSLTSTSNRKSTSKTGEKRKNSYNKDLQLSDQLANVVGGEKMPRSEVVKRMWSYFKEHHLLDPQNKQFVNCDETLTKLFGRKRIRAFGMLKDLSKHMNDPEKL